MPINTAVQLIFLLGAYALAVWLIPMQLISASKAETPAKLEMPLAIDFHRQANFKSGLNCSEATNDVNAIFTYEFVRLALKNEQSIMNIEYLDCFLDVDELPQEPKIVLRKYTGEVFNSNVMYSYLQNRFRETFVEDEKSRHTRRGKLAWRSYSLGNATVRAYDSTGEQRFVDLYVDFFYKLLSIRDSELGLFDDFHGKVMNSWGSTNLQSDQWVSHVNHFSVIMLPATAIARRIKAHPELVRHVDFANRVIQYFDEAYIEFDSDMRRIPESDTRWYWRPLQNKFEATNHLHLQGQALLNMYALTEDELYHHRITDIISAFELGAMVDSKGLAAWNYHPYFQTAEAMSNHNAVEDSEFVWKAALTIPFLYQASADGFDIDQKLLKAVTKTVVEHVIANGDYALNFHPINEAKHSRKQKKRITERYYRETHSITRYLSANTKNAMIAEMILETFSNRQDLFPSGWFGSEVTSYGYAFYLMGSTP